MRLTEPAAYPSELEDHIVLSNLRLLRIRPLRRCEESTITDLYDHLSPRTRYLRFFSQMPRLPDDIQYRFLDRDLILHDTRANLIIDRLPCAITCAD